MIGTKSGPPCTPLEQTSKFLLALLNKFPPFCIGVSLLSFVMVPQTGPCAFFSCKYAIHLDRYEDINKYRVILMTTHEIALHISHLYLIYTKYAYSIRIQLTQKAVLNYSSPTIVHWFSHWGQEWDIAPFICQIPGHLH